MISWTRDMGRSSGRVQWQLTWMRSAPLSWARVTKTSWMSRISGKAWAAAAEADFELAVAFERGGALDGGGFAFDVGEDGGDLGDLAAHLGFELGDEVVGGAEGHRLVDFEVLLDVEGVVVLLDADVVDGEVGAGGDGADAVVDAFGESRRWGWSG